MTFETAWVLSLYIAEALSWLPLIAPGVYLALCWKAIDKKFWYLALTYLLSWAVVLALVVLVVPASLHWDPHLREAILREAGGNLLLQCLQSITGSVVKYWWAAVTFGGPLLVAASAVFFTLWLPRKPFFRAARER